MSMKAGELLETMKIRFGMQTDGITNPSDAGKDATRSLVEKLTPLNPNEKIRIVCGKGMHTEYIRKSTGEILATIEDEK